MAETTARQVRGHGTGLLRPGCSEPWPPPSASLSKTRGPPLLWSWRMCGQHLALDAHPTSTDPRAPGCPLMAGTLSPASPRQRAAQVSVSEMPGGQRAGAWPCWLWVSLPTLRHPHCQRCRAGRPVSRADLGLPGPNPARWAASSPRRLGPALPPTQCATEGVRGCPGTPLGMGFRNAETGQG